MCNMNHCRHKHITNLRASRAWYRGNEALHSRLVNHTMKVFM
ncbi:hypothetical protein MtrunA17_Chr1g0168651 [Medicago truncatula]|uniref:Uncharacterized protein n=1 Tax=Medicago truncatula TaxID=3880 RepID=A0A396JVG3_MEDTR|nr:hypothetical protein MtrunA17_Chr1g0168651 [Medicago truncatula]